MTRHETDRLILRKPDSADGPRLFAIYGDPETHQFNPAGPHADAAVSMAVLGGWLDHWQRHGFGIWAIEEKANPGFVIGFGGLGWAKEAGWGWILNLGYRFSPAAWGKGYATEMGQGAIDYAAERLAADRIHGLVRPHHAKSVRVLHKLGFREVGTLEDTPGEPASLVLERSLR
ncbi:GNAT family N-acetyltransferase [Salinicola corii]|uniref:GNAT family N-acetyltransferase n=1 Tax=Salinicola corii TaxID=2606937 RepID=A0A640WGZ8_9GAMM|nr:GNAT family N-acetyltransferase [Salinicola corii]KAA0019671.1 GNAT family N-acetyltransferase [Salinicola corii]